MTDSPRSDWFVGEIILQPTPPMLSNGGIQTLACNGSVSIAVLYEGRAVLARLTPAEARAFADHLGRAADDAGLLPGADIRG